jgi:hypothetical protein
MRLSSRFRLWSGTAGDFRAVAIAVAGARARRPADAVRSDALLPFFNLKPNLAFHRDLPPLALWIQQIRVQTPGDIPLWLDDFAIMSPTPPPGQDHDVTGPGLVRVLRIGEHFDTDPIPGSTFPGVTRLRRG